MNLTASDPDAEAGRIRRAWRSRTAFRLSALLVVAAVVVAAAAGIAEVTSNDDGRRPAGPAVGAPAAPALPAATTDTDPSVPTTPFPVDWEVFQTVAFPVGGNTYGPAVRRADGLVAGWSHTPRGAVLAALNIDARVMLAADGQWQVLLDATMQPGPGRDLIASYRRQDKGPIVAPEGGFEQIAGFRVVTYTPDVAVVSIASQRSTQDVIQVTTATVRWIDGDWKLQLQPDGSQSPYATTIPDLASAGFVPFWAPR